MNKLTMVPPTHPILRQSLTPYMGDPADLAELAQDMAITMLNNGGIGLAAPQVGELINMFVMGENKIVGWVCINPQVIESSEETISMQEGCLTYPGLFLYITRPESIKVAYTTTDGRRIQQELSGIYARCFQHECDHLNGITFDTLVSSFKLKRAMLKRAKKR